MRAEKDTLICALTLSLAVAVGCAKNGQDMPPSEHDGRAEGTAKGDPSNEGSAEGGAKASSDATALSGTPSSSGAGAIAPCLAEGPIVLRFGTADGVELEADLYTTGKARGTAAVLLHMIPPANDRSNYAAAFIDALVKRGITVINVDRRGAGASQGAPKEAYEGAKGELDARAAVRMLMEHPCRPDPERIVIIGASNGTTTALDYAVAAATDPGRDAVAGLVFLSGGDYTENQNQLASQGFWLQQTPILFVYPQTELQWNARQQKSAPDHWQFQPYAQAAHGTQMFEANPQSIERVASFVAGVASR